MVPVGLHQDIEVLLLLRGKPQLIDHCGKAFVRKAGVEDILGRFVLVVDLHDPGLQFVLSVEQVLHCLADLCIGLPVHLQDLHIGCQLVGVMVDAVCLDHIPVVARPVGRGALQLRLEHPFPGEVPFFRPGEGSVLPGVGAADHAVDHSLEDCGAGGHGAGDEDDQEQHGPGGNEGVAVGGEHPDDLLRDVHGPADHGRSAC